MDLLGKTALVIGAGSVSEEIGNGRAIAILFARHGAHVICADLNLEAAEATADSILQEGGSAQAVAVDASKEDQVRDLVESTVGDRGRLDVLQNNVGVATVGGVVDTDVDTWDRDFDINLKSAFLAMKFAIPHMVSAGTGGWDRRHCKHVLGGFNPMERCPLCNLLCDQGGDEPSYQNYSY